MKTEPLFMFIAIQVMCICALPSFGQDDSNRYQGYIIWEDVVYPSRADAYEKATKMQMQLYAEQDFPQWIGVFSLGDFSYFWMSEINSYADIDTLYKHLGKVFKDVPEKAEAVMEAFKGTHESTKTWTCFLDRELSYSPEIPEGSPLGGQYRYLGFCYGKQGEMDELKEVFKGWKELATSKSARQGWNTYIGDMGVENPFIFWSAQARGPAEFFAANGEDMTLLGEDADELWIKQTSLMRKYEDRTGWYRIDLSYFPKE